MGRPLSSTVRVATPTRLLDAAEASFAASGYNGAKLADIARTAGIRRSSLLYHFESKQALYTAVVERVFGDLGAALMTVMDGEEVFEARVRGLVRTFVDFLDARPTLAPVLLRDMLDGHGPGRAILMRQVVPLLDVVERFLRNEGGDKLRPGLPLRAALMRVVADILLRSAAGDFRQPMWGPTDHAWELTEILLFDERGERAQ